MRLKIGEHVFWLDVDAYQIECILLFGSYVNGEADEKSDIDILIIVDGHYGNTRYIKRKIARDLGIPNEWLMVYTKDVFRSRAYRGTMFFQGLKHFAKVIYQRSHYINRVFKSMPWYADNSGEILLSKKRVSEALYNYQRGYITLQGLLRTVAFQTRNLSMQICYRHGQLEMRKYEPVRLCLGYRDIEMPFTLNEYRRLYEIKRSCTKGIKRFEWSRAKEAYVLRWIRKYMALANQVERTLM